jgi:arylsulfatase A-like enzyme/thioredoxin-like negative regulator of GroEL
MSPSRVRPGLAVLLLAGGLACGGAPEPPPERIVLVTIDTLRADHLGCYGAQRAHTPHLDAIAEAGVRFAVALSPAPLTLPAHASLMTGLDPPGHGVRHNSLFRLGAELPTLAEGLREAGYATAAVVGALVLERRFGLARGFDHYDDRIGGARRSAPTGFAERSADRVVDAALAWLADAPSRFFLWVHFYDPHMTHDPPPGFAAAFADSPYDGEIAFVDAELGRLLGAIAQRFGEDGLLLVATADHGESLGEHGEITHSYTIYEATQRVPLLMRGPGVPAGAVVDAPVSLVDVAPTVLALARAEPLPGARGHDLGPLLRGDSAAPRTLYMETVATQLDFRWSPLLAVRAGSHKYIRAPRPELYDLERDPAETRNLAPAEPEHVARLDAELERHLAQASATPETTDLSPADRARLRSLGYVVPDEAPPLSALGVVGGADPKDRIGGVAGVLVELAYAQRELADDDPEAALARLNALGDAGASVSSQRAVASLASGDAAAAEREARRVLTSQPARTDMRVLLARALLAQGCEAQADAELALLPPDAAVSPWVSVRVARALAGAGDLDAALERLESARERAPRAPLLARAEATLLEEAGRLDDALAVREAALSQAPDDPERRNEVAWSLALLGRDLDRALLLARQAAEARDGAPHLLDTLATVHLARGEAAEALAVVERALGTARGDVRRHLLELRAEATRRAAGS